MTADEIRSRVAGMLWLQSIDLGHGVVTPGTWGPPNPYILAAFDTIQWRDARVLDVGCCDGAWSFEAERRGAKEVYATDDVTQLSYARQPTLETARDIRGSSIQYFPDLNVYDVTQRFRASYFDTIIFTGVYYHLKDPLRALALLRRVLKPAGMIIVEGPVWLANFAWASFHYRDVLNNDKSNWWVPTLECLREWIECNFFEIRTEAVATPEPVAAKLRRRLFGGPLSRSRVVLTAQAVTRADCLYSVPDPLLNAFNLTSPDPKSDK